jgi:hypothetical protein
MRRPYPVRCAGETRVARPRRCLLGLVRAGLVARDDLHKTEGSVARSTNSGNATLRQWVFQMGELHHLRLIVVHPNGDCPPFIIFGCDRINRHEHD